MNNHLKLIQNGLPDAAIAALSGVSMETINRDRRNRFPVDQWLIAARRLIDAGASPKEAAAAVQRPLAHLLVALKRPPTTDRVRYTLANEVRELYRSGLSIQQITAEVQQSRLIVSNIVNNKSHVDPDYVKPEHPLLAFPHLTAQEASEQLDMPITTVYQIRRKSGRKQLPAHVLRIRAMAKAGAKTDTIAKAANRSRQSVLAIVRNVSYPDPDYTPPPTAKEVILASPDKSVHQLHRELDVTENYVRLVRGTVRPQATPEQISLIRRMALKAATCSEMQVATGLVASTVYMIANNRTHHDPNYTPLTKTERRLIRTPRKRTVIPPHELTPGIRCSTRSPHRVTLLKTLHMPLRFNTLGEAQAFARRAAPHLETLKRLSRQGGIVDLVSVVEWLRSNPPPAGHQTVAGGYEGVRPENLIHWPIGRPVPRHRAVQMGNGWVVAGRMFSSLAEGLAWPKNQHHDEDWAALPLRSGLTEEQFCGWCNDIWPDTPPNQASPLRAYLMPGHNPGPTTIVAATKPPPFAQCAGGYWARYDDPEHIYDSAQDLVDRRHST